MYIPASRHAVHWSKAEANWLHSIPLKLPKCKPHEPCCLQHQEAQSTQEFLANQDDSLFADFNLLFFHLFQLLYPWVYWIGSKHRKLGIRVWVNLATFNQEFWNILVNTWLKSMLLDETWAWAFVVHQLLFI